MTLKLLVPPPVIGLLCGAGIWALGAYGPPMTVHVPGQTLIAYALMAAGLLIDGVSILSFFRAKTTISPLSPDKTTALVQTGLYRFSRNPMYLGMLALLTGYTLLLGTLLSGFVLAFFVAYLTAFQIKPEEARLTALFGADFIAYKQRVRRWL